LKHFFMQKSTDFEPQARRYTKLRRHPVFEENTLRFALDRLRYSLASMKHYLLSAVALIALLITAQAQPAPANNAVAPAPFEWGPGLKVLIVAGGYAHDYGAWDNKFDTAVLQKAGITSVHYTEDPMVAARELSHADVLLLSANAHLFVTPQFGQAVSNFVSAGKGLVLLHSGTWYAWASDDAHALWVGGGARGHDGLSQFDETIIKDHPVTRGLPATFKITDELYHVVPAPGGSPMEILAEASRPGGQKWPSVWVTHYGSNRIVGIALGHDGPPRKAPEFSTLLVNAVKWAGGQ
jgi:type 1 glutamine amidotransferase